jgi:hypothetical protein
VALPAFFANAIGSTSGILYHYTLPDNEINDWLVEKTMARFGVPPDLFDADGMNAAIMLVEALKATGGAADKRPRSSLSWKGWSLKGRRAHQHPSRRPCRHSGHVHRLPCSTWTTPKPASTTYVSTNRPDVPCFLPEGLQDRCGDLPVGSLSGE